MKEIVEMTPEELAEYNEFKAKREQEKARQLAKEMRKEYEQMVNEEVEAAIPELLSVSEGIKTIKSTVWGNFRAILDMKADVMRLTKDNQRTHTFTNAEGNKRITLGVYTNDAYRDTVEDGIAIVKEYIEGLANDAKTNSLVSMVLKLLTRDAKGNLKASRVLQLRKQAEDLGDERFLEGVRIIEESYQPTVSKQFISAEVKNDIGAWVSIPLGMTEA